MRIFYKKGGCKQLIAIQIAILLKMKMIAGVLQDVYSCLVLEQYHSLPKSSLWLAYPPPKLSTSLLPHVLVSAILCDNNSSKKLSKNLVLHDKSKHIDIRFNFLRELVKDSVVNLSHCNTQDQVANIMTKPRLEVFLKLRSLLGIYEVPNIN